MTKARAKPVLHPGLKDFGRRVMEERRKFGLNQTELAARTHLTSATISGIETGHTLLPYAQNVLALCHFFDVRPEWLLTGEGSRTYEIRQSAPEIIQKTVEKLPAAVVNVLARLTEELQYAKLFCGSAVGIEHVERWLTALLDLDALRVLNDNMRTVSAAEREDVAEQDKRARLHYVQSAPAVGETAKEQAKEQAKEPARPSATVSQLPDRVLGKLGFAGPQWKGDNAPVPRADGLLRAVEVCALAGISSPTFYQWQREDKDFPRIVRSGKSKFPLYRRKDVERWIAQKIMEGKGADARGYTGRRPVSPNPRVATR